MTMFRQKQALTITLFVLALTSCAKDPVAAPAIRRLSPHAGAVVDEAAAALPALWAREVTGQSDNGAFYDLLLPQNWNGRLVVVIHGLIDPALPVAPIARTAAVDTAGAHGYAFAFSSFAENGWAIKSGVQSTHELTGLFTDAFGRPSHVYLYAQSMGGLIALDLAESYPTQYDGVVSECGIIGGSDARLRYMIDTRLLFDYFYPGILQGNALGVPPGIDLTNGIRLPARNAILANMAAARTIAAIAQTPIPYTTDPELESSLEDQLFRHAREINDVIARGHGEPPVDRSTYTSSTLDPDLLARINDSVPHFSVGNYAAHYAAQYYEPTGDLHIPVLSLYTDRDPALPAVLSDTIYSQRLAARNNSAMFRRQRAAAYGHCTGKLADRVNALRALVTWAENATAPW
ncbi:MAG TPA: hypothetical protein VH277_05050 [Gemmatimonadaceae bacterium]|jgi:pimeloyl-ACP methyl ester carboxylesterase|nr:hypothetical protein [Gemmatimonadaceae bacterium]